MRDWGVIGLRMKHIWSSSVAKVLLLGFAIVITCILGINLFVLQLNANALTAEVRSSYQNELAAMVRHLNKQLVDIAGLCNALATDADIATLNYGGASDIDQLFSYRDMLSQLKFAAGLYPSQIELVVYLKNKGVALSSSGGMTHLTEERLEGLSRFHPNLLPTWELDTSANDSVLVYTVNTAFVNLSGIAVEAKISLNNLYHEMETSIYSRHGVLCLIDATNRRAFGLPSAEGAEPLLEAVSRQGAEGGEIEITLPGKDGAGLPLVVLYDRLLAQGLYLSVYYSEPAVLEPINRVRGYILLSLSASVLLSLAFIALEYKSILKPIRTLVRAMGAMQSGDLTVRLPPPAKSEFGYLYGQFNKMAQDIDTLVNQVYAEKLNAQQATLMFLQSQINPHFLYNSLGFIYQMCKAERADLAAEMAIFLSEYFRYAAGLNQEAVGLSSEVNSVRAYLNIHALRFPNKYTFAFDIPDALADMRVPPLILQPLAENAIVHGLSQMEQGARIEIAARQCGSECCLTIRDNGAGMGSQELAELRERLASHAKGESMHGLINTHRRIRLRYGEAFGIEVDSEPGAGTLLTLRMPI